MKKMYFASILNTVHIRDIAEEKGKSVFVLKSGNIKKESKHSFKGKYCDTELEAWQYLAKEQRERLRDLNAQANNALEKLLEIIDKIERLKLQDEQSK